MRKKCLVLIALVLCLLLLATMFVACNKDEDLNRDEQKETEDRNAAILALSNALLSADSDTWQANMSDADIAKLTDAGDYIISNNWVVFFCDVINTAEIRTAKIQSLTAVIVEAVKEEKDRKAAAEQTETTDDDDIEPKTVMEYIKLVVSKSDLLGSEMSSLAYVLLYKVIDEADIVYRKAETDCIRISERGDLSGDTRDNVNAAKKEILRAKTYLNAQLPETKQQEIVGAMAKSKDDFQSIFSTMYDTLALLSIDISSLMSGGEGGSSISSLSTQDILNVLFSLKKTIGQSNSYFQNNQESVETVSKILRDISSVVDTMVATNDIIGAAVTVVRYSGSALSILPFGVSFLYHSWDALNEQFIDDVKEHVFGVDKPLYENYMIFFARMIKEYRIETGTDFAGSKEYTYDRIDELDSYVDNDQYAALIYLAVDAVLNLSSSMRYVPGDDEAKNAYYQSILRPVTLFIDLTAFKNEYTDYIKDETKRSSLTLRAGSIYDSINTINPEIITQFELTKPTDTTELDDEWYINYHKAAMAAFFYCRDNTKESINPDLKHYIDETYPYPAENPVDYIISIATNDFAIEENDPASTALKALAEKVIIVKLLTFIPTIIKTLGA